MINFDGSDSNSGDQGELSWDPLGDLQHVEVVQGCACAACQGLREAADGEKRDGGINTANPDGQNIGTLLDIRTNPDGSRSFSGDRNVDATLIGSKWGTLNLTYSFPTQGSDYNGTGFDSNGVSFYHLDLGTQQELAAKAGFALISSYTNLTFTQVNESETVRANIRISQSGDNDVGSAYGGFPSDTRGVAGDIWFGRTSQPYYDLAVQGTWGFSTMLHEIGHTMGLKHGHQDYTNSNLAGFFGTSPRFGSQSLTPDRDGQAWSLMTYTPAPGTANFAGDKVNQPQSYMQYDIAALQYMYGANYNTNSGNTTYTWNATTGEMSINGVGQGAPSGNKILATIWDGGGIDTIDASNYSGGVSIDLRPGEFSTLDTAQLANHLAAQNLSAVAPGNIAMSLLYNNDVRSLVENAKGGSGNDVFITNGASNLIEGGEGSDTVVFSNVTGVNVTLNDTGADVIVDHGGGEVDTLRSIENIGGTAGNDVITGNSLDNVLTGGSSGTDRLSGGDGSDRLVGGGFSTINTAIVSKAAATANLSTATAVNPQALNAYTLLADASITNATTVPHATINATATGGGLEYYRIDATAGATAIFDIDASSIDTWIELVRADGTTVLAQNDDSTGDAGSSAGNSYLSYTFAEAGVYYIRVGRWTQNSDTVAQPLATGTTYTLHISLSSAAVNASPIIASNNSSAILEGGNGDDFLQGTLGNDVMDGGAGNDTASFVTAFSNNAIGVTVDLNVQGVAQDTGAAGTDRLSGIENLIGSQYNDTLTGDDKDNVIEGGLGNDVLSGGAGDDTASYAGAGAAVTVSLALQGAAQATGSAGSDTLTSFENLAGSAYNDTLTGDSGVNVISGGAGNDTLNPGLNSGGAVDLLDGGVGSDTASFAGQTASVTATLAGSADGMASVDGVLVANLRNIENLQGGSGDDLLTGDDGANEIEGGFGNDVLVGGAGIDTLSFRSSTVGVTVNLATLTAQATGVGNDTISGFENVRTTAFADNIVGDANVNTFFEAGGADSYNGAGGSDTVDYSAMNGTLSVNLNLAAAQNTGAGGTDTLISIENIVGSALFANTLQGGNATANRLVGGSANDFIIGNGLNDTLIGGAGNDVIFGDYVNTFSAVAGVSDGNDVLEGGAGGDSLVGGMGNDILRGGDGDDILVGGIANGTAAGLSAVYTNDGGMDVFDGGEGTDMAYAYYTDQTGGIRFDLANIAGNSAVTMGGAAYGEFISIERVIFRGGSGNDEVRATASADTLVGNAGDDVLDGWYGNDTLSGGLGNDTLIGGEGLDTATYVNALSGVTVDLRITGAQDTGGEGVDTLIGIEYLTGSNFGDTLRGNDDFNLLIDNAVSGPAGQPDMLFGYGGNDSILVTRGAATVATTINMDGGDGNDLIELRGGTLSTALAANATGLSTVTYLALGATSNDRNVDVVEVDGGAGDDRIVLTGVARATVRAGSGNDTVSISMRGASSVNNYLLTLGAGADIIQLGVAATAALSAEVAATARTNVVTDFEVGNSGDRFEMTDYLNRGLTGYAANSNAFASGHLQLVQSGRDILVRVDRDGVGAVNSLVTIFTLTNAYTGGFTAFNFDGFIGNLTLTGFAEDETITGATGNDVLGGGDGNDTLIGLAGNDTLDGGNGDDILRGGSGDDILIGGDGIDTASYSDGTSDVFVDLSLQGTQVDTLGGGRDTLTGIENIIGSAFNDTLYGDGGANRIEGGAGNDVINGRGGADTLVGGIGNDTYVVDDAGDNVTELAGEGVDTVQSSIDYVLTGNVENLELTGSARNGTGNALDNHITGNGENNLLDGGAGADAMAGGLGDDTYIVDNTGDVVTENENAGLDLVRSSVSYALAANVENLELTGSALNGTGNALDNRITGNSENNTLDGGAGADTLTGGAGNDRYIVDNAGDLIVETLNGGSDTVASSVSYTLVDNVEDLELTGTANINGFGNAAANKLTGNSGSNILDGGSGADTMAGGTGDDRYFVDNAGDVVIESLNAGRDEVVSSLDYTLGANLEDLTIVGSARNGTGNSLNNRIEGNAADNVLRGEAGDDTLLGGTGSDTLFGGSGNDVLIGGDGFDTLYGGAGNDTFVFGAGPATPGAKGGLSIDVIFDFDKDGNDILDFGSAKVLSWETFGSINSAEKTLGVDLDGSTKTDTRTFTTVVYGDSNNDGIADFAVALIGSKTITTADIAPTPALATPMISMVGSFSAGFGGSFSAPTETNMNLGMHLI
jgi:Ca2+-binding RTX toxin-like protein